MPIYEYACRSCGAAFEALVYGDERPACPSCAGKDLEKRFSAFAVGGAASGGSPRRDLPGPCGSCGDPRGPGACGMN
jgi:putative FmdB family regulatory protein